MRRGRGSGYLLGHVLDEHPHLTGEVLGLRFLGTVLRFRPGEEPEAVTQFAAENPNPFAGVLDGLAVDACGNLYPLLIGESRLVRVSPDGPEVETVADATDGPQTPTSLAFGAGEYATSVFVAEFAALAGQLGQTPAPKVVQVDVGVPGPEAR